MKTLLQAIGTRDHGEIDRLIEAGQHPLSRLKMCIQMRGDAVATIMQHVPLDCAQYVRRTVRHLELIGRYPHAQRELLVTHLSSNIPKRYAGSRKRSLTAISSSSYDDANNPRYLS